MQAAGILRICTGFLMVMVSVALPGHIKVMVLAGVESGVVRIQTSVDICVGRFTSEVFLICNKHHEVILLGSLYTEQRHMVVGLLKVGKVWLCYKIDHLLLSRFETGWWKVPLPWFHP